MPALLISPHTEDHAFMRNTFERLGRRLHAAGNLAEARPHLKTGEVELIVCASDLDDGNWKDVLSEAGAGEYSPLVIVFSPFADERFWLEVLSLGGFDVLPKPFDRQEVLRIVGQAWEMRPRRARAAVADGRAA